MDPIRTLARWPHAASQTLLLLLVLLVTVLVLGGEPNLAFRASILNIGLLLTGIKTPEHFIRNDVLMVNLDKASGAK
jgi:hypothetical protein